jgi:hypothetical protein
MGVFFVALRRTETTPGETSVGCVATSLNISCGSGTAVLC